MMMAVKETAAKKIRIFLELLLYANEISIHQCLHCCKKKKRRKKIWKKKRWQEKCKRHYISGGQVAMRLVTVSKTKKEIDYYYIFLKTTLPLLLFHTRKKITPQKKQIKIKGKKEVLKLGQLNWTEIYV